MSREIKFRAWDRDYGEYEVIDEDNNPIRFEEDKTQERATVGVLTSVKSFDDPEPRYIFEQYTGLKDKNGKEIYEGDIVRINDDYEVYGTNAGRECEIWFEQGGFRYKPEPWSAAYEMGRPGCWLDDGADCEVIGNIHENGDSLNDKKSLEEAARRTCEEDS